MDVWSYHCLLKWICGCSFFHCSRVKSPNLHATAGRQHAWAVCARADQCDDNSRVVSNYYFHYCKILWLLFLTNQTLCFGYKASESSLEMTATGSQSLGWSLYTASFVWLNSPKSKYESKWSEILKNAMISLLSVNQEFGSWLSSWKKQYWHVCLWTFFCCVCVCGGGGLHSQKVYVIWDKTLL